EITVKVFLAHVLIDAIDAALQDREVIFGGIGRGIAPHIFFLRMDDGAVTGELLPSLPVNAAFVGAQVRSVVYFGFKDGPQIRGVHFRNMSRADTTLALDKRDN